MKSLFGAHSLLSRLGKGKHASNPRLLARLQRDEAGAFLLWMTVLVPVLIGAAGFGTEVSLWVFHHQRLQSAADAAAYSAVVALSNNPNLNYTVQAKAVAASGYGFVDGQNGVTVDVNGPVEGGPTGGCFAGTSNYIGNAGAVEVVVKQPLNRLFSSYWYSNQVSVCGRAVAVYNNSGIGADCILALATTGNGITLSANNVTLSGPTCGFFSNSNIAIQNNGDQITAFSVDAAGTVSTTCNNCPGVTATAPGLSGAPPQTDPYKSEASLWPSACVGTCTVNGGAPSGTFSSDTTISPGAYPSGITVNGNGTTVTMQPGIYYLNGDLTMNNNNQTLTSNGQGVTIVLTGNSTMQTIKNGVTLSITAPTGNPANWNNGIAIWQPTSTGTSELGKNNGSIGISGVIYSPTANWDWPWNNGASTICTQIVVNSISLSGNNIGITYPSNCSAFGFRRVGAAVALVE